MLRCRSLPALLCTLLLAACATRTPAPVVERPPAVPAPDYGPLRPAQPPQSTSTLPPVPEKDWRPEFYTVKRGDTLYAVALEHGLDYRELAAMNNIENINVIRVGQVLRLRPPGDPNAASVGPASTPLVTTPPVLEVRPPVIPAGAARPPVSGNSDTYKVAPKAIKLPYSDAALAQLQGTPVRPELLPPPAPVVAAVIAPAAPATPITSAPFTPSTTSTLSTLSTSGAPPAVPLPPSAGPIAPAAPPALPQPPPPSVATAPVLPPAANDAGDDHVEWGWPVRGRIISGYSETANLKGIDIGGSSGTAIVSSAPGKVVYAGSGLRGYGKLVIVKHNKTYLSAYAHLDQISIREGQSVTKGQELGKMGNSDADQVKLHFEIRVLGKPVDPLRYLPRG